MSVEVVFWSVVLARFALPLLIPRFPLPAIVGCLVLDAARPDHLPDVRASTRRTTRATTRRWTCSTCPIAYLASLRNWTNLAAVEISRFLFFYRQVGVVAFELTGLRFAADRLSRTPSSTSSSPTRRSAAAGTRRATGSSSGCSWPAASGSSSSCRRSTGSTSPSSTSPTRSGTSRGSARLVVVGLLALAGGRVVRRTSSAAAGRLDAGGSRPTRCRPRSTRRTSGPRTRPRTEGLRRRGAGEGRPDRADQRDLADGFCRVSRRPASNSSSASPSSWSSTPRSASGRPGAATRGSRRRDLVRGRLRDERRTGRSSPSCCCRGRGRAAADRHAVLRLPVQHL